MFLFLLQNFYSVGQSNPTFIPRSCAERYELLKKSIRASRFQAHCSPWIIPIRHLKIMFTQPLPCKRVSVTSGCEGRLLRLHQLRAQIVSIGQQFVSWFFGVKINWKILCLDGNSSHRLWWQNSWKLIACTVAKMAILKSSFCSDENIPSLSQF